jgi:uncharacterized membrane protein
MAQRDTALDVLRGAVIVLMALDHTRDFFQPLGTRPEDPQTASLALFAIRWLTHYCAPVFVFLAGVSVRLMRERGRQGLARFVAVRGLWLMLLEPTWVSFSWYFSWDRTHLGVLWAIGASMVLLSALLRWPRLCLALGCALSLGLAWVGAAAGEWAWIGWLFWPQSGQIMGQAVIESYPPLPWFALMAVGYGAGAWLVEPTARRRMAWVGMAAVAAFFVLRAANIGGDPRPWGPQPHALAATIDFFAVSKYPPSILFQLMTLGPALALLPWLAHWRGPAADALSVYGRVPMFFYLAHLPLIHLAGMLWAKGMHGTARVPGDAQLSLVTILVAWVLLGALLWPVCRAWRDVKTGPSKRPWMAYL